MLKLSGISVVILVLCGIASLARGQEAIAILSLDTSGDLSLSVPSSTTATGSITVGSDGSTSLSITPAEGFPAFGIDLADGSRHLSLDAMIDLNIGEWSFGTSNHEVLVSLDCEIGIKARVYLKKPRVVRTSTSMASQDMLVGPQNARVKKMSVRPDGGCAISLNAACLDQFKALPGSGEPLVFAEIDPCIETRLGAMAVDDWTGWPPSNSSPERVSMWKTVWQAARECAALNPECQDLLIVVSTDDSDLSSSLFDVSGQSLFYSALRDRLDTASWILKRSKPGTRVTLAIYRRNASIWILSNTEHSLDEEFANKVREREQDYSLSQLPNDNLSLTYLEPYDARHASQLACVVWKAVTSAAQDRGGTVIGISHIGIEKDFGAAAEDYARKIKQAIRDIVPPESLFIVESNTHDE